MALEEKSFEELEKWVTNWMGSWKPDMEFHADKNGTYMYTAPTGNSSINLKYFFTSVLEDYLSEQEELSAGNPATEESALPIAGVGGAEGEQCCNYCKGSKYDPYVHGHEPCPECSR